MGAYVAEELKSGDEAEENAGRMYERCAKVCPERDLGTTLNSYLAMPRLVAAFTTQSCRKGWCFG